MPASPAKKAAAGGSRIPTPLVLAASSAMVSIGLIAIFAGDFARTDEPAPVEGGTPVRVDASTPERAAETFLDAWRKRDHAVALSLAVGPARDAVTRRRAADEAMDPEERALKTQLWDPMAASRLSFVAVESEELGEGRLTLGGRIEGEFLGRSYRRQATFVVEPHGDDWRVADMQLGEILSDLPDVLAVPGAGPAPGTEPVGPVAPSPSPAGEIEMRDGTGP